MASRHGDDDGTASTSPNTTIDHIDKTSSDFNSGGSSVSAAGRPSALEEEFHDAVEAANGPTATRAEPVTTSSITAPSRPALEHPGRPASPVASAAPTAPAVPFPPVPSAAPAASMTSTLPVAPGRTAQPNTATPAAAAPSDPAVSSSIPIRQPTTEAYRPPSPPLPPVPFEWQSPVERRRNQEPAPLPPFPPEWTYAASRSNATRSQQRQPSAASQTRTRSSTSTASSSAARRTSTAGAESSEAPLPPAPAPAPAPAAPPSLQPTPQEQRQQRQQRQDITLPRWQPDAEVTYCPICFQHFNIFVRKHHCRPPPTPQIAEEDECPVCHNELPKRSLPNFETLREAHITECLETQSRYMGGSSSRSPTNGVTDASTNSTSLPANTAEASSSTASPPPPRMTGMFPYRATEKDCVDAAECTICLEDLEVGVPMARLECFCRFHERCIRAWFKNHPGRCPVHQHDNFGY
ncbi:hypothetical protein SPBR_06786 [Sporothrix brasiliensis 5110]|uniref:RING-type E3 ubiquitin transferase n=1 Tax=Sporothrix brasiliensis 5110 TaxID=1398154 RepID=A0A0C2ITZ2_9PEZI|nr:uncharacterized protein SPBR_06786 [Sporothrix brasiliensis 5110]KIH88472.1 hypothetical protein SPBR_06786 [Sporothrix brasiliensis 5110]